MSWWGVGDKIPAPRWDPTCESREDYQQRHERYLQMLETQAEQDGLVDAPIKHAPEHFEWLACFHFRRWTINQIAEEFGGEHGKEDRSVTHGINDTAALCGLTIDRPRSRPPKTDR